MSRKRSAVEPKNGEPEKVRSQTSTDVHPPTPPVERVLVRLDTAEDFANEVKRLYHLVDAGEMEAGDATKRVHILREGHSMMGSQIHKTVQELEKRLIEAGLLPKRVAMAHE